MQNSQRKCCFMALLPYDVIDCIDGPNIGLLFVERRFRIWVTEQKASPQLAVMLPVPKLRSSQCQVP